MRMKDKVADIQLQAAELHFGRIDILVNKAGRRALYLSRRPQRRQRFSAASPPAGAA